MTRAEVQRSELFILIGAVLWSLFPVITALSYRTLSPFSSLGYSALFAAFFFACMLTAKRAWKEVLSREAFPDIFRATIFLGIGFYTLKFFALAYTTPGNVAIIALSEIFWSYVFFTVLLKEHMPRAHIAGALCMGAGALIVLFPSLSVPKLGDFIMAAAAMVPPAGNFFMRRARETVSSETIMFWRSLIAGIFALACAAVFEPRTLAGIADQKVFLLLVVNGALLLGLSKIFWIESIRFVSVMKGNALSAISPAFTLVFAFLFLQQFPSVWQLSALVPIALGITLLRQNGEKQTIY